MSRLTISILASVAAMLLAASSARAQYDLSWFTIDGGGAMTSTGGAYELSGTIGQPDASTASPPLTGGTYQLVGGFWAVAAPLCTCPGDLNGDNLKNGRDVQQFVACVISGGSCACADLNGSGTLDATDVSLFVNGLLTGGSCP